MKRLHVHVSVNDLNRSVSFYSTLFGAEPTVLKGDDNPVLIVEHHPEPAIGKDLVHNTFNCKQFFFRHKPIVRVRRDAPDKASRG
jgi:catechol 2,3-dioxygenase-like lactoylglutathione lyase family enzyme